jgi:DNA-directed RNA polymerase specialized sigma24 family protein
MSKMSELSYDIQELYIDGFNSRAIAEELGCPLEIVTSALAEMNVEDVAEKPHEEYSPYYGA